MTQPAPTTPAPSTTVAADGTPLRLAVFTGSYAVSILMGGTAAMFTHTFTLNGQQVTKQYTFMLGDGKGDAKWLIEECGLAAKIEMMKALEMARPAFVADLNRDHTVDLADHDVWFSAVGTTTGEQ